MKYYSYSNSDYIDIDTLDFDDLIGSQLKAWSATQPSLQRLEGASDSYQRGTLPPWLCQSSPFVQQTEPTKTGEI